MQSLEVNCAVRRTYTLLGAKRLNAANVGGCAKLSLQREHDITKHVHNCTNTPDNSDK
jgi:hypothetical protein